MAHTISCPFPNDFRAILCALYISQFFCPLLLRCKIITLEVLRNKLVMTINETVLFPTESLVLDYLYNSIRGEKDCCVYLCVSVYLVCLCVHVDLQQCRIRCGIVF